MTTPNPHAQRSAASFITASRSRNLVAFIFGVLFTLACTSNKRLIEEVYIQKPTSIKNIQEAKVTSDSSTTAPAMNDCLSNVGNVRGVKLYSQNDEDGALLQTLRCMGGHGTKEYFEFGSESGEEVNTRILRDLYGWHGHLLDGSNENPAINLHLEWFTPSNIVSLLEKYKASKNLDVLSVDCDYDDLYVTREILVSGYRPRVLITEFNINFGGDMAVSVLPKPVGKESEYGWKQANCYYGASAMAYISLVKAFGYTPVWSNNVNLIFVQLSQAEALNMIIPSVDRFPGPYAGMHSDCMDKTWVKIEPKTMEDIATDKEVSHRDFAMSLPAVQLAYNSFKSGRDNWRIFYEKK